MFSPKKTNNNRSSFSGRNTLVLVLLFAIFASTCLLPISEAKAANPVFNPAGAANQKILNIIDKAVGSGTQNISPGTAAGTTVDKILKNAGRDPAGRIITGGAGAKKGALLGGAASAASSALKITGVVAFVIVLLGITQNFVDAAINMKASYYNLNNALVNRGWVMLRDICNLFFLLVLLFIAFCTILQIEKYNAKKNLLTLILMALLINFSKPIAIFIFDGSQLLMQWFLRDGADITSVIGLASHIGGLFSDFIKGGQDLVAGVLIGIVFIFIYIVVLFCLGLFLFIRLVAIWLLVIVSPVAFFALILPDFRKLSTQWWDALFRYSYVGPAIAFFLWLSSALTAQIGSMKLNSNIGGDVGSAFLNSQFFIPYIITIVFLFAALMMANQFGIHFSQSITKSANRFMGWAASNALKWGERSFLMQPKIFGKQLPFSLSPRAWIKGWQEHSAEIDRRALEQGMAQPRDFLSSVFRRGERPKTYFRDVLFSKLEQEKMKEIESVSTESSYMFDVIDRAKKNKSREAQAAASAALKILAKNNDQDDYMIDYHGEAHDPLLAKQRMKEDLMATGLSEHEVGKIFYQLGNIALPAGNMGYWGMSSYNKDTGKYEVLDDERQLGKIRAKSQTFETQQLAKILHRNALMTETGINLRKDPETGKVTYDGRTYSSVHRVGQVMAEILAQNEAALEQFKGRGKVDTLAASGGDQSYGHWETLAKNTLEASRNMEKAAEKFRRVGDMQNANRASMQAKALEKNMEIYLKFGETAHAAYSHGKEAKVVQITAPALKAFKGGAASDQWRKINAAEIARLAKEAEDARRAGESKPTTESKAEADDSAEVF
jgi:hypothetical protein